MNWPNKLETNIDTSWSVLAGRAAWENWWLERVRTALSIYTKYKILITKSGGGSNKNGETSRDQTYYSDDKINNCWKQRWWNWWRRWAWRLPREGGLSGCPFPQTGSILMRTMMVISIAMVGCCWCWWRKESSVFLGDLQYNTKLRNNDCPDLILMMMIHILIFK